MEESGSGSVPFAYKWPENANMQVMLCGKQAER